MKNIKTILAVFTLSVILGVAGVSALGERLSFVGFNLKNFSGVSTSAVYNKTKQSLQYMNTIGAVDNITGGDRAVSVQTVGSSYSSWISAPKGQYVSWQDASTKNIGGYYLNIKATKSTLSTVTYNGTWFLDDSLV